jgi:hypothetical protein
LKAAKDELEKLRGREAEFNEMKMLLESKALDAACVEDAAGDASEVGNGDQLAGAESQNE